ncbi:Caldesmon [Entamoeba marina]
MSDSNSPPNETISTTPPTPATPTATPTAQNNSTNQHPPQVPTKPQHTKKRFDEVAHLKKERGVMKQQLEDIRKERNALKLQIDTLKSENDYIRGIHEESENKLRDIRQKCKETEAQLSEKSSCCASLQNALASSESDRKVEIAQHDAEMTQIKKRLSDVLTRDLEELRGEVESAKKRALEAEERIEENRKAARAAEEREIREKVLGEELQRALEDWKIRALEAENITSKAKKISADSAVEVEKRNKSVEELESKVKDLEIANKALKEQLEKKEVVTVVKQEVPEVNFEELKELEILGAKIGELQMEKRMVIEENKSLKNKINSLDEELTVWRSETVKNYILYFGSVKSPEELERERVEQTKRASFMNYLWKGYSLDGLPTNVSTDLSQKMHRVLEETLYNNVKQQDEINALKQDLKVMTSRCDECSTKIANLTAEIELLQTKDRQTTQTTPSHIPKTKTRVHKDD